MENESLLAEHHAFLIISKSDNSLQNLKDFLKEKYNFACDSNNPDFWQKNIETFGIEDSRELKNNHLKKSISRDSKKIFVIKADFMTIEAQNALLKVIEEPLPGALFFFIISSKDSLLKTLLSRVMTVKLAVDNNHEEKEGGEIKKENISLPDINYFLSLSAPMRIEILSELISLKDKNKALEFLEKLEFAYRKKTDRSNLSDEDVRSFEIIAQSRNYLNSPSPSVKIILENISLVI